MGYAAATAVRAETTPSTSYQDQANCSTCRTTKSCHANAKSTNANAESANANAEPKNAKSTNANAKPAAIRCSRRNDPSAKHDTTLATAINCFHTPCKKEGVEFGKEEV